jgi:hypothetical protein
VGTFLCFLRPARVTRRNQNRDHAVVIPTQQVCFAAYGRHGCRQLCRREDLTGLRGRGG